jgi:hypothetical protein
MIYILFILTAFISYGIGHKFGMSEQKYILISWLMSHRERKMQDGDELRCKLCADIISAGYEQTNGMCKACGAGAHANPYSGIDIRFFEGPRSKVERREKK